MYAEEGINYITERICLSCSAVGDTAGLNDTAQNQNVGPTQDIKEIRVEPEKDIHSKERVSSILSHKMKTVMAKLWMKISGKGLDQERAWFEKKNVPIPRIEVLKAEPSGGPGVAAGTLMQMVEEFLTREADSREEAETARAVNEEKESHQWQEEDKSTENGCPVEEDSNLPLNHQDTGVTPLVDVEECRQRLVKRRAIPPTGCVAEGKTISFSMEELTNGFAEPGVPIPLKCVVQGKGVLVSSGKDIESLRADHFLAFVPYEGDWKAAEEIHLLAQNEAKYEESASENAEEEDCPVTGADFPAPTGCERNTKCGMVHPEDHIQSFLEEEFLAPVRRIERGKPVLVDSDDEGVQTCETSESCGNIFPHPSSAVKANARGGDHENDGHRKSRKGKLSNRWTNAESESLAGRALGNRPVYWKRCRNVSTAEIESARSGKEITQRKDLSHPEQSHQENETEPNESSASSEKPTSSIDNAERNDSVDPERSASARIESETQDKPSKEYSRSTNLLGCITSPLERVPWSASSVYSTENNNRARGNGLRKNMDARMPPRLRHISGCSSISPDVNFSAIGQSPVLETMDEVSRGVPSVLRFDV